MQQIIRVEAVPQELPALMSVGRWKSSKTPVRYIDRQLADRGAVAKY